MHICITGRQGCGKSTITKMLNENDDYIVVDVDTIAHEVLKDEEFITMTRECYGDNILDANGQINRKALGKAIFDANNTGKYSSYNDLIWPFIEKRVDHILATAKKPVILEWMFAPITKYFTSSAFNIFVDTPKEIRRERVLRRDDITEEYFEARDQKSVEFEKYQYDFTLFNDGKIENTMIQVKEKLETFNKGGNKMNICFCAGSFDPWTNGHQHVVKKASTIFDKVIIGIGTNPDKVRTYPKQEMEEIIMASLIDAGIMNAEVVSYDGLTVDVAKELNVNWFVRGTRNSADYKYEESVAVENLKTSDIDTMFLRAGELGDISSSFVKQEFRNSEDITDYVPAKVKEYMLRKKTGV